LLLNNGLKQLLLIFEVNVKRSFRDAGFARNLPHARPIKPALQKYLACPIDDLAALRSLRAPQLDALDPLCFLRVHGFTFALPVCRAASRTVDRTVQSLT